MAAGNRMFLDSTVVRNLSNPGSFSADQMLRSHINPFPLVQFIPERVLEFSISPEGMRFYKVHWQETWLPEHHLVHYQNLIENFWRSQSELDLVSDNDNHSSNIKSSHASFADNTTRDDVDLEPAPLVSEITLSKENSIEKQTIDSDIPSSKNVSNNPMIRRTIEESIDSSLQLPNLKLITIQQQQLMKQIQPQLSQQPPLQQQNNLDKTQHNLFNSLPLEEDDLNVRKKPNELVRVISQDKKNKATTLQLEEFEIVNIKNTSVTDDEIKNHAREILSALGRKRGRRPNGSSKLSTICFFCTKVFSTPKKLREHNFSVHLRNFGKFVCGICQQRFAYKRKMKAHMIVHTDNRNFVCKICGLTCKRRAHLYTHMQAHEKEENYRCDACHANFKVQADLKNHCLNEHKNQVSKCNVCKQTLHTPYSIYIHSTRHSGTREHTCQVCPASFKSKHHLITHQKTHKDQVDKIKCPACDKEFSNKKYLRNHLELNHKEIAQTYRLGYKCSICNKDFAYKGRLDEHMKMHEEETEEERNARVKNSRSKKVELLPDDVNEELSDKCERIVNLETGEVKLKCKLCNGREYRLISTMERHLEDHKSGKKFTKPAKSFECSICTKTFQNEARLLRHNVIQHAITKPIQFQCRNCKGNFRWKSCLQTHMKKCKTINKGASKRKASLKAREQLKVRQIEQLSSDDERMLSSENKVNKISPESNEIQKLELKVRLIKQLSSDDETLLSSKIKVNKIVPESNKIEKLETSNEDTNDDEEVSAKVKNSSFINLKIQA